MTNKKEYEQLYNDEKLELPFGKDVLKLACCDCGLIHYISIKKSGNKFKFSVKADGKATATYRRHNKKDLICVRRKGK